MTAEVKEEQVAFEDIDVTKQVAEIEATKPELEKALEAAKADMATKYVEARKAAALFAESGEYDKEDAENAKASQYRAALGKATQALAELENKVKAVHVEAAYDAVVDARKALAHVGTGWITKVKGTGIAANVTGIMADVSLVPEMSEVKAEDGTVSQVPTGRKVPDVKLVVSVNGLRGNAFAAMLAEIEKALEPHKAALAHYDAPPFRLMVQGFDRADTLAEVKRIADSAMLTPSKPATTAASTGTGTDRTTYHYRLAGTVYQGRAATKEFLAALEGHADAAAFVAKRKASFDTAVRGNGNGASTLAKDALEVIAGTEYSTDAGATWHTGRPAA